MTRAAHSFFAAFAGWLAAFVGLMAWLQIDGYITDFPFYAFWPLAVTFAGWLVVALPIVVLARGDRMRRPGFVIAIATAATSAVWLAVAAALSMPQSPEWWWWPLVIGVVGGAVYWVLETRQPLRPAVWWVAPFAIVALARYVALPAGIRFFPYATYVITEGVIGQEAEVAVIERVRVGDTYADLHRRYPQIFDTPTLGMAGQRYSIAFDALGGRVTRVETHRDDG